jgi:hypothetical protein
VKVGSEFTGLSGAHHGCDHLIAHNESSDIRALGFLDVLLDKKVGFQLSERCDYRLCRFARFSQNHSNSLGPFKQFDYYGRPTYRVQQASGVSCGMRKSRHWQANVRARKQLEGSQLVARPVDRLGLNGRKDSHDLKLPHNGGSIERVRGANARDYRVEVKLLSAIHDRWVPGRDVHVTAEVVDDDCFVASLPRCLNQPVE